MSGADSSQVDNKFLSNAMAAFVQIAAILVMLYWCFLITAPFANLFVWGLILSVAVYPAHVSLSARLGGREKMSAILIVLVGIAIIAIPASLLVDSTVGALQVVAAELEDGTAKISPPNDSVANWPVVGERVHEVWSAAAINLEGTLNKFQPQLQSAGQKALSFAGHTVASTLLFIVSVIIAGVLLMSASAGYRTSRSFLSSIFGVERGPEFTDLSVLTIRSVAKGVLGIAFIQAILSAIGLAVADVPAAGLWAGLVLVLAIVQLPPLIVLGPIAIWYFSVADPVPATIFLVYAAIVSVSDAFLKPLLLGRGVETPMLVILIGAIGGAIFEGIMGLFTGAVILALGYEIFMAWLAPDEDSAETAEA